MSKLVIAKYKSKKKLDTGTIVYEYSEADKKKRAKKKAQHVRKVFQNISKIKNAFEKDMKSSDKKLQMVALAVGIIYEIFERVGDRGNIGTGVVSLKKKHITVHGDKVHFKYVGKSYVKQDKTLTNSTMAKLIKENLEGKGDNEYLFDFEDESGKKISILSDDINEYLKPFHITAKDLRAHAANDILISKLKAAEKAKGETSEEKEKWRKDKLKELIEETADEIGHTPEICRSSYIDPSLIEEYISSGKIIKLTADQNLTVMIKLANIKEHPKVKEFLTRGVTPEEQAIIDSPSQVRSEISDSAFTKALEKAKAEGALAGLLDIVEDNDESAFGVTPIIVGGKAIPIIGVNINKIKSEAAKGKPIEEILSEQVKQILGVIAHEQAHVEGQGEAEAERVQKERVEKIERDTTADTSAPILRLASEEKTLFQKLGVDGVDRDNLLKVTNNVLKKIGIPNTNQNIGLLALGYLLSLGNNPYRAEWNIRKAIGLETPIDIKDATIVYNILNSAFQEASIKEDKQEDFYSFSDEDKMNLGDIDSLKWESEPSYSPGTGMGFYPQVHPFNY
jgi:DNA topoisomerase IB